MPIFRATVWHCSSMAQAIGDKATMRVYELSADDEEHFKALIRDMWINDVDAEIEFGPISMKEK